MKRFNIILECAAICLITSCSGFLEPYPSAIRSEEFVLESATAMQGLVDQCYDYMSKNYDNNEGAYLDCLTDNAVRTSRTDVISRMAIGVTSPANDPFQTYWDRDYKGIYNVNLFLKDENGRKVRYMLNEHYDELLRNRLWGEAYALRAWFYFDLLTKFGGKGTDGQMLGIPLVLEPLKIWNMKPDEIRDIEIRRATYAECVEQIEKDCDEAIKYLPKAHRDFLVTNADDLRILGSRCYGRLDGITMSAVKALLYLTWASPRFNPDNDVTRWEKAAKFAKGAFLISADRKNGNTTSVTVSSEKGGTCRIHTGITEMMLRVTGDDGQTPQWKACGDGILEIYMKKGETVTVSRRLTSYKVNYDEAAVPKYELPDPLVKNNGKSVKSVKDWEQKRRPEIMDMLRREMYGYEPGKPAGLHFKVLEESHDAFGGKATRRQVAVYFTEDESRYMTVLMYIPNDAKGPVPAFMGMNFRGNYATTTDPEVLMLTESQIEDYGSWYQPVNRGDWGRRWPYEYVLSKGYAVVTMFYGDVDPDWNDGFHNGVHGLLDKGKPRTGESWSTISAWAWGLSRALDYLETDKDIDAGKVAVLGHSRLGKTALWAGATDQRFALVISNCSGCCGSAISRRKFGETIYIVNDAFQHWFCGNFEKYSNNEDALPFDQHELISMIAPRPVYVSSGSEDNWADQKGEYLSLVGATPVYNLYGYEGFTSTEKPGVEDPETVGRMGNHMRKGDHDILLYDWTQFINFADKFLK